MKNILALNKLTCLLLLLLVLFSACENNQNKAKDKKSPSLSQLMKVEVKQQNLSVGDSLLAKVSFKNQQVFDSVRYYLNKNYIVSSSNGELVYKIKASQLGNLNLTAEAFLPSGKSVKKITRIKVLSDIIPTTKEYTLVNTYPHSSEYFTQGLMYIDGYLYEGTGGYGESVLVKSDLKTGNAIIKKRMPNNIFGEGMSVIGNRIYQLSYQASKAFVYDFNTFEKIDEFTYPFASEGWGLTTFDNKLIMSNGSHVLFVLDTATFQVNKEIQVWDNKAPVSMLNELELVGDKVYANLWTDTRIAEIELSSGRVLSYLDLEELVPQELKNNPEFVLNGIAVNPKNGNLFVTGKRWPVLYEISLN